MKAYEVQVSHVNGAQSCFIAVADELALIKELMRQRDATVFVNPNAVLAVNHIVSITWEEIKQDEPAAERLAS
jgi:hypothetical protein